MKNNVYPCKTQFYYIKVEFKGVKTILACFRDVRTISKINKNFSGVSINFTLAKRHPYSHVGLFCASANPDHSNRFEPTSKPFRLVHHFNTLMEWKYKKAFLNGKFKIFVK